MSSVGILFVGAALLVNGLLFLGRIDPRGAAVFNLFVGALQTAIPFYLIATAQTPDQTLAAAGVFLFGFTYLYVGVINLTGIDGVGLGWYSAWVSTMALGFGVVTLVRFDDPNTALLWAQWSVLWGLFFAVLALGRTGLTRPTGWLTVILSFTTCTIPGFLMLLGVWADVPVAVVGSSIVLTAVAVVAIALRGAAGTANAAVPEADVVRRPDAVPVG